MMKITAASYKGVNYCLRCGHKLVLKKDRENKLRPVCENCGWIYYKNPIPAAACVIFNEKKELVIIKRKFEPSAGAWALPSGYIEINNTPEETAVEEMKEETGLDGEVLQFLAYYPGYSPIYEQVLSFGFLMKIIGGKLQAGDDASDARFVKPTDLPEIAFAAHRHFIEQALEIMTGKK